MITSPWTKVRETSGHRAVWPLVLGLTCALLAATSVFVFTPGFMSEDTIFQLRQALGRTPLNNWHPPAMSLLWRALIDLSGSVATLALLQVVMLWGSLFGLALAVWRRSRSRAWSMAVVLIGCAPFVQNYAGVVWKDVHMAFALLGVVALAAGARERPDLRAVGRWVLFTLAVLLLAYAALVRRNALLAVPPLFLLLVRSTWPAPSRRWVVTSVVLVSALAIPTVAIDVIAKPIDTKQVSALALDDVLHVLSVNELRALDVSPPIRDHLVRAALKCQRKGVLMNSYWSCYGKGAGGNFTAIAGADEVFGVWVRQMAEHPSGYLQYRTEVFTRFLFANRQFTQAGIIKNDLGMKVSHPRAQAALTLYVQGSARSLPFLFTGWFWLLVTLALTLRPGRGPFRSVIRAMGASAVLYLATYFPFAPETDFRYVYWPVLAGSLGAVLALGSELTISRQAERRRS